MTDVHLWHLQRLKDDEWWRRRKRWNGGNNNYSGRWLLVILLAGGLWSNGVCANAERSPESSLLAKVRDRSMTSSFNQDTGDVNRTTTMVSTVPPTSPDPLAVFPEPIEYTQPVVTTRYASGSRTFDPRGMNPLYFVTNMFLDFIQKENLPSELWDENTTYSSTIQNFLPTVYEKKEVLIYHYTGLLVTGLIGLFLAIILTLGGFTFCICRCAGRCGAKPSLCEKKLDPYKRFGYGFGLSGLVILLIFGIVCAFVTNQYVEDSVRALPKTLNEGLDDVNLYQNNTKIEVHNLLVNNFQQLELTLDSILDKCGEIVKMHLAEVSRALAIENLTSIVSGLGAVREDLNGIVNNTLRLQQYARQLQYSLNATRTSLKSMLENCVDEVCLKMTSVYNLELLRLNPDFENLPDVTRVASEISRLIKEDIESEVKKGKGSLDGISEHIQSAVKNTLPQIKQTIRQVGMDLEMNSEKINLVIDEGVHLEPARESITILNDYLNQYSFYRYYASVGVCCVILLIILLFTFGLFCGFCGRNPNYVYGDDSCSRGTGARLYIIAVYLIFLFYFVLMVSTTALFLVGGVSRRTICDPIEHNPNTSEALKLVNEYIKLSSSSKRNKGYELHLAENLGLCNANKTAYHVLHLEAKVNIDAVTNYKQRFRVKDKIKELADRINLSPNVTILTPQAKVQLQQLAYSKISDINFTSYSAVLDQRLVDVNLTDLVASLNTVYSYLLSSKPDLAGDLMHELLLMEGMHNKIILPMRDSMNLLRINLKNLQRDIRFNKTSFQEGVSDLITQAEKAQNFIQSQGRTEVINLANKLAENFTGYLDEYANRVNYQVKEEIGKCWPVSQAVNGTIVAVCKSILYPFNGFWIAVGVCLILFIPCIFISVRLSNLYKKTDLQALPSAESDCFSDILPDRDTIPLANHRHKKRRRQPQITYDNQNGYVHDASPTYPNELLNERAAPRHDGYHPANTFDCGSGSEGYELDDPHTFRNIPVKPQSASRTPLQEWEFQGDAPPHYNSATNLTAPELERPPPYYFPGPSPAASKF